MISASLAREYARRVPIYGKLARLVQRIVASNLRQAGIPTSITYRVKAVDSFIKKAIDPSKSYLDPLKDIHDKAGVRIVAGFMDDFREVQRLIRDWFPGAIEDDKTQRPPDSFGYIGVHFDVPLSAINRARLPKLKGEFCEIQLHSRANNLWSESEHDLVYKAVQSVPVGVQRRMNRLVALTELFDSELSGCRAQIQVLPGYENAQILASLERQFFRFTASAYRQSLSLRVIDALRSAYPSLKGKLISDLIEDFATNRNQDLRATYRRRDVDPVMDVMLSQPESLLVFERLSANRNNALREAWMRVLPLDYLIHLAELWGSTV